MTARDQTLSGMSHVGSSLAAVVAIAILFGASCKASSPPRFPSQPTGCEVRVFRAAPALPMENIGSVRAICGDIVSDDDCLRTLKDEVCKLGGDVVWGVADRPEPRGDRKEFSGRAAHTVASSP